MSTEQSVSEGNARRLDEMNRKLDRAIIMLEGTGSDAPGLMSRIALIERVLFGHEDQEKGIVFKVGVLWRMQTWLLCVLSGAAGFLVRELIRLIWKV